ncbi:MAG: alpha/beta hydrolase [Chitinophagaceae bacterium]
MTKSKKILFYHGGPGLNGQPERMLLTTPFEKAGLELLCWDEPSQLRPDGYPFEPERTFDNFQRSATAFLDRHASADEPVIVMVYCFSSWIIPNLLALRQEKIQAFCIVSPDFHVEQSDLNVFKNLLGELRMHGEAEKAEQMAQILDGYTYKYDENTEKGWRLAARCLPLLFNFYWHDQEIKSHYLQHYKNEYSIDAENLFCIRRSLSSVDFVTDIPTLVIYGKHDKIVSLSDEKKKLQNCFTNLRLIEMEGSGHYPHIEQLDEFVSIIRDSASDYMVLKR